MAYYKRMYGNMYVYKNSSKMNPGVHSTQVKKNYSAPQKLPMASDHILLPT